MNTDKLREELFNILHAYVEFLTDKETVNAILNLPALQSLIKENAELRTRIVGLEETIELLSGTLGRLMKEEGVR